MKVRALRGVCIGVERHLLPGDTEDLDAAQVQFLTSIGAVELVPDEPAVAEPVAAEPVADEPAVAVEPKSTPPAKAGKKEK